jgi:hypothetical protein
MKNIKTMTDERRAELLRYFEPRGTVCGCVFLGSERAEVCGLHGSEPREIGVVELSAMQQGLLGKWFEDGRKLGREEGRRMEAANAESLRFDVELAHKELDAMGAPRVTPVAEPGTGVHLPLTLYGRVAPLPGARKYR